MHVRVLFCSPHSNEWSGSVKHSRGWSTHSTRSAALIAQSADAPRYCGLDLSPYYLQYARELLADVEDLSLVADNAEAMPFRDGTFDIVTSVHLFHELPRDARRNVYREIYRLLRPGGLLVIQDSGQQSDGAEIAFFLARFSSEFHEPYHRDYVRDDMGIALRQTGFEVSSIEPCFVAKTVVAHKPR